MKLEEKDKDKSLELATTLSNASTKATSRSRASSASTMRSCSACGKTSKDDKIQTNDIPNVILFFMKDCLTKVLYMSHVKCKYNNKHDLYLIIHRMMLLLQSYMTLKAQGRKRIKSNHIQFTYIEVLSLLIGYVVEYFVTIINQI